MSKTSELLMTDQERREQGHLTALAYLTIVVALLVVVLLGMWGAYREIKANRSTILEASVNRLRPLAARRAWDTQNALARIDAERGDAQLSDLVEDPWFQRYWQGAAHLQSHQLYAAIVDNRGRVVFHSDPQFEAQRLRGRWYDRIVREVGDDVVEIRDNVLAGGRPSFDIRAAVAVDGEEVGGYHEGLSMAWIEDAVADERARIIGKWFTLVTANVVAVLAALVSLYYIAIRSVALRKAINMAHLQRVTEVGQLAAGLAHEIRNPLHTLRLNLHTLRRVSEGKAQLNHEEIVTLTSESQAEIDRVDQLMRELLGFASPEKAKDEDVDLREEVQATLDFLNQELRRGEIRVDTSLPEQPVMVHVDPNRIRQVMLNLLLNAKEVLGQGGELKVRIHRDRDAAQIIVADNGPGVPPQDRHRIFDPFFTTKNGGTGFGLAMVKRYVTEAGGSVMLLPHNGRGTTFQIRLPIARPSGKE